MQQLIPALFVILLSLPAAAQAPAGAQGQTGPSLLTVRNPRSDGFRLWPGDVIDVKFFFNKELDVSVQIRPDGRIMLPFAGEVEAGNHTVREMCDTLNQLYSAELKNPAVTIEVRAFGSQKVYVGGEVLRPGVVSLTGQLTLLEAIMEVGGVKVGGSNDKAILIRKGEDGIPVRRTLFLDGGKSGLTEEAGLMLVPYDVVLVPTTKVTKLDRWVDSHVRQVVPFVLTFGFSYLLHGGVVGQ
jgi:polysaccharide export outer membrane protein